jgi:maltose alpha-D-glucosyltransferase/alpha-amylase
MQWSAEKNGGFSEADGATLVRPVTSTGKYSYRKINVASQKDDPDSFLSWMKRLIKTRKEYPLFGVGEFELWEPDNAAVFALRFFQEVNGKQRQMLTLHNFSNKATTVELDHESDSESDNRPDKEDSTGDWQLVWSDSRSPAYKKRSTTIKLAPFGYRWLCRESKQK